MKKLLYIVYYYCETDGDRDFVWVIANTYDDAIKTAEKQYREECGLEKSEKLDIKFIDAFMVESGYDYDDNKYNIIIKKG